MGNNAGKTLGLIQKFKKEIEDKMEAVPIYPPPGPSVIHTQSRRPAKPVPQHAQKMELDAEPIQGNNDKLFYVEDGRRQILDTAKWPNSVHGVVAVEVNGMMAWGTGIMIGPRIVLTAGHNLFDFDTQLFHDVKTMRFLPGMNGKTLPFGAVKVEQYFVSPNYVKNGKQDYGILILKKPIGELTGYFGLACLNQPEHIKGKRINVTGYPADKVIEKPNTYEMWGMEGEASEVDRETGNINYLIDTGEGQNGSGVWYKEGEEYYVCGVHRGAQFVDQATLLTGDIYKQIYAWVQELGLNESVLRLGKSSKSISFKLSEVNTKFFPLLINYHLDDLETLHLQEGEIGDQELKILAQKTFWSNLSHIKMSNISLSTKGAQALALNSSWVKLKWLELDCNSIGAEGAKALAKNASWFNLSLLNLSHNSLTAEGGKALAQNTSWSKLENLYLAENRLGEGASALARNTSWINLLRLDLKRNGIDAEGAKALAQNTCWTKLLDLDLSFNNIGAEGAIALGQNTSWINLSWLDLTDNCIGEEGGKALAHNISWTNLSMLDLQGNNLGSEAAKSLARNTCWINLLRLDLNSNGVGTEGTKALAQNTSWTKLSNLDLSFNNIDAEGVSALAKNTSWINLSILKLSKNHIGEEAGKALASNTSWTKLWHLDLSSNKLGAEGASGLASNTSWIKLWHLHLSHNEIGIEGGKGLASNTSWINLWALYLSRNNLGPEGSRALAQNTSWINLQVLDLENNKIEDDETKSTLVQNTFWKKLKEANIKT